jgi:hypothetical protein
VDKTESVEKALLRAAPLTGVISSCRCSFVRFAANAINHIHSDDSRERNGTTLRPAPDELVKFEFLIRYSENYSDPEKEPSQWIRIRVGEDYRSFSDKVQPLGLPFTAHAGRVHCGGHHR